MSSRTPSHLLPAIDSDVEDGDQSFASDFDDASMARPLSQPSSGTRLPATAVSEHSLGRQDVLTPCYQGTLNGAVGGAVSAGHNMSVAGAMADIPSVSRELEVMY